LLHPHQVMFRDRALIHHAADGKPPVEQEADYFAACFLVPPKLVRAEFRARFNLREPMTNTHTNCFLLCPQADHKLQGLPVASLEFALAVARAESFNGQRFKSLAALFNVSPTAMAIRLQEMDLVA
jgi:hypothetical protein